MEWFQVLVSKIAHLFQRNSAAQSTDEEVRMHLELLTKDFVRQGMTQDEAVHAARRQFGTISSLKQDLYAKRSFWTIETLLQDTRYALRTLRSNPVFATTAAVILMIGIGANTAIFTLVNQVLIQPLTYPDPSRIVLLFLTTPQGPSYGGTEAKYNSWRKQKSIFQDVAAYEYRGSNIDVTEGPIPEQIHDIRVSAAYFRILGASFVKGGGFNNDDDQPRGRQRTVLSYSLWQRRFGGDAQITGKTISLNHVPVEVAGVTSPTFDTKLDSPPDLFLPFQIDPESSDHAQYFNVLARLKDGVSFATARARLDLAAQEFRRRFPNIAGPKVSFGIQELHDALVNDSRQPLLILSAAVLLVLLIACSNVASLLLVRATGRKRELAIRKAMGAGRVRILRQMLTESVILFSVGGTLGLFAGLCGLRAIVAMNPGDFLGLNRQIAEVSMDWRVFLFVATISLVTGVLFGLAPALDSSREDSTTALKEGGGRTATSYRQNRMRSLLVTSETALAVILLIGAGLLIRSFIILRTIDRGIDTRNVLTMRMSLANSRFSTTTDVGELIRETTRQLEMTPGVLQAGASYNLPLDGVFGIPFNIVGRARDKGQYDGRGWFSVSSNYFRLFNIPVLRGRPFADRDNFRAARVAIINETMARTYWPGGNPIGSRVKLGENYGAEFEESAREIVGVVGDVRDFAAKIPQPTVYVPVAQQTDGITKLMTRASSLAWLIRTRTEPYSLRPAIEATLRRTTGGLPVTQIRSMQDSVATSTAASKFQTTLLTIFGLIALLLAAVGIYGLMAYSFQERKREIGIRLALGAEPTAVRNMLIGHGVKRAMIGLPIGLVAAFGLSKLMASALYGIASSDPLTFVAVPGLMVVVILIAVAVPARRAVKVDAVLALRHE